MSTYVGNFYITDTTNTTTANNPPQSNDFLLKANNLSDLPNRNTARENLGITVAIVPPGSPKLNDLWVDLNLSSNGGGSGGGTSGNVDGGTFNGTPDGNSFDGGAF
jgi:hypothetical protein